MKKHIIVSLGILSAVAIGGIGVGLSLHSKPSVQLVTKTASVTTSQLPATTQISATQSQQPAAPSTAPTSSPAPISTGTQTTTSTTPQVVFQASSTDYPGSPVELPAFDTTDQQVASYSYTCSGDGRVTFVFFYGYAYGRGTIFSSNGSTYSGSSMLPTTNSTSGHFEVRYDTANSCTWNIAVN